jgi:hypothetical protein
MRSHFNFDLEDERDQKEDDVADPYLSPEHQAWLAGMIAKLYERMAEAERNGDAAPNNDVDASNEHSYLPEGSAASEADPNRAGDPGADFGAGSFWSSNGDFNF